MAITKYDLDINKQAIIKPVVILRQGDHDIDTMQVSLSVANEPMDLTGAKLKFMGTTANGKQIIDDVHVKIIDAKDGVFEYVFPSQAASDIGEYKVAYFSILLANGQSSTMDFRVQVLSGVDISAPVASEYIAHYDTMVSNLNSAYDSATKATNQKVASTVSSLATSAATVLDSALTRVNTINSTANSASSAASKAVSMASSVANTVTSQASYINSVASSAESSVSSVAAGVVDKLNNISVGGRNLLLDTGRSFTGIGNNSTNGNFDAQGGRYPLAGSKKVSDLYNQYGPSGYLTLSFDWVASGSTISGTFNPQWDGQPYGALTNSGVIKPSSTNTSGHYKSTVQLNTNGYSTGVANAIKFRQDNLQGNVTISNVKLEIGNVPTDWTPAPEDVDTKIDNIKVGGRNYIINSSGLNASDTARPSVMPSASTSSISNATISYGSEGITLTYTGNGSQEWYYALAEAFKTYDSAKLDKTKQYTISVEVKGTAPRAAFRINNVFSPTVQLLSDTWSELKYTFKFADLGGTNTDKFYIRMNAVSEINTAIFVQGQTLSFRNFKLEEGNVATDWTPAPEDAPSNDAQLVHKTGPETIDGDKTFVGSTTFAGIVTGGQVNLPASGDINTLTDTGKYYQSNGVNVLNWSNRPSNAPNSPFAVDVIGHVSRSLATQMYYSYTTSRMWIRTLWPGGAGIASSPWVELANDANVVHKTENETVAGDKTFTGNVTIPKNKVTVNTAYGTFTLTKTLDIVHIQSHISKDIPDNINVPNVVPQGFRPDGVSVPMTFIHGLDKGVVAVNPDGSLYTSSNIVPNTSFLAASWAVAGN